MPTTKTCVQCGLDFVVGKNEDTCSKCLRKGKEVLDKRTGKPVESPHLTNIMKV
jgi:hypothetical protein